MSEYHSGGYKQQRHGLPVRGYYWLTAIGAPGPENLTSPIVRNSPFTTVMLDATKGAAVDPNRARDLTDSAPPNTNNGTVAFRRRITNNTGAPVTRLRFRIIDITSLPVPGGIADLRALTSVNATVSGITDPNTCLASTGSATTPCTITVQGTTLEAPTQALGGALNSTLAVGTITLGTPPSERRECECAIPLRRKEWRSFQVLSER